MEISTEKLIDIWVKVYKTALVSFTPIYKNCSSVIDASKQAAHVCIKEIKNITEK